MEVLLDSTCGYELGFFGEEIRRITVAGCEAFVEVRWAAADGIQKQLRAWEHSGPEAGGVQVNFG
jgi:hypothetical protein